MELLEKLKDNHFKKEFEAKVKEKTNMPLAQAISITASEYGYETSPEELEKIFVVNQDLDENELEKIGGGVEFSNQEGTGNGDCTAEYCCEVVLLHPETLRTDVDCFYDYLCSNLWVGEKK